MRDEGSGIRVWAQGSGFRDLGFRIEPLGFRDSGFKVDP
jgi:hypothetical protein